MNLVSGVDTLDTSGLYLENNSLRDLVTGADASLTHPPPWLNLEVGFTPAVGKLAELRRLPWKPSPSGAPVFIMCVPFREILGVPTTRPGTVDSPMLAGSPTR